MLSITSVTHGLLSNRLKLCEQADYQLNSQDAAVTIAAFVTVPLALNLSGSHHAAMGT